MFSEGKWVNRVNEESGAKYKKQGYIRVGLILGDGRSVNL